MLLSNGGNIMVHPSKDPVPGTTWSFCDDWNRCAKTSASDKIVTVPNFSGLLQQIHERAPHAKIRVLLYPRLFSDRTDNCTVALPNYSISGKSAHELNRLADELNTTILYQVNQAKAKGIDASPVDPNKDEFDQHRLCDSGKSWFNGAILWAREFSFHPNAEGQRHFADWIKGTL
jgi:hypothetical protein